jgi:type IV secretory pathway TrbF-like protein
VVKHVDEVELRVVVATVLAVAPDAVLVAQHLLNRGAHTATAPARQYTNNLAHRTDPPACE